MHQKNQDDFENFVSVCWLQNLAIVLTEFLFSIQQIYISDVQKLSGLFCRPYLSNHRKSMLQEWYLSSLKLVWHFNLYKISANGLKILGVPCSTTIAVVTTKNYENTCVRLY